MNLTAESHVRVTRAGLNWMKLPPHVLNHFSKADFYNLIDDRKSTGNPEGKGGMTQGHCRRIKIIEQARTKRTSSHGEREQRTEGGKRKTGNGHRATE